MSNLNIPRPDLILWIYIVLLVVGGMVGFLRAGSRASLIASTIFAIALALCAIHVIKPPLAPDFILAFLVLFFGSRLAKSKKLMPNGLMLILTILVLALRHLKF